MYRCISLLHSQAPPGPPSFWRVKRCGSVWAENHRPSKWSLMASTRVSPPLKAKQHAAVFVSILLLWEARLRQFVSSLKGLQETEREGEAEESLPLQLFPGGRSHTSSGLYRRKSLCLV